MGIGSGPRCLPEALCSHLVNTEKTVRGRYLFIYPFRAQNYIKVRYLRYEAKSG